MKYRGAHVSEHKKKCLNDRGGELLRKAGFDFNEGRDYDWIIETTKETTGDVGYADYYLVRCWNESKMVNEADASVYRQLVEIDTALGTAVSMQLWCCLSWTTRWDIIKVLFCTVRFQKLINFRVSKIPGIISVFE